MEPDLTELTDLLSKALTAPDRGRSARATFIRLSMDRLRVDSMEGTERRKWKRKLGTWYDNHARDRSKKSLTAIDSTLPPTIEYPIMHSGLWHPDMPTPLELGRIHKELEDEYRRSAPRRFLGLLPPGLEGWDFDAALKARYPKVYKALKEPYRVEIAGVRLIPQGTCEQSAR